MNWSKAKTILILALLATNLFLIFTYGFKDSDNSQKTNEDALMSILSERGIYIDTEIPKGHRELPILQGEYAAISTEKINSILAESLQITEKAGTSDESAAEAYIAAARTIVTKLGLWTNTMTYDYEEEKAGEAFVIIKNQVNGISLEGSYIKCFFQKGKLTDIQCKWLIPTEFSHRKVETISAAVALMSIINPDENDIVNINSIEMVYWIPDTEIDVNQAISDTAFPSWKLKSSDGKEFFVEAVQR